MQITRFRFLSVKPAMLLFVTLYVVGISLAGNIPAFAEPQMRSIETSLEGTRVIRNQVNAKGQGTIVLHCSRCRNDRVRLKVTTDSYATLNGQRIPIGQVKPGAREFITGFYKDDTRELNRLIITRK